MVDHIMDWAKCSSIMKVKGDIGGHKPIVDLLLDFLVHL